MSDDNDLFDDNNESNDVKDLSGNEMHQMPDGSWVTEMKDWSGNTVYVDANGGVLTSLTDVTGHTVLTDDHGGVVVTEQRDFAGNDVLIDAQGNQVTELGGPGPVNYSGDTGSFGVGSNPHGSVASSSVSGDSSVVSGVPASGTSQSDTNALTGSTHAYSKGKIGKNCLIYALILVVIISCCLFGPYLSKVIWSLG